MTDSKSTRNLAVVGMDIAFPGGEGLTAFGRLVYRGIPMEGRIGGDEPYNSVVGRTVQRALQDACVSGDQIPVITLSTNMAEIAQTSLAHLHIQDTSGSTDPLGAALAAAHEFLLTGMASVVLLLDSQAEPQILSALVLSLPILKNSIRDGFTLR